MRSPCHRGRECYTSINQSIKLKALSHLINQSTHNLLVILLIALINQSINLSFPWRLKYTQSINQLTTIQDQFSPWVVEVKCKSLSFFRVFLGWTVLVSMRGAVRPHLRCDAVHHVVVDEHPRKVLRRRGDVPVDCVAERRSATALHGGASINRYNKDSTFFWKRKLSPG